MPEENGYDKVVEALADMNEAIGNRFDRVDERFDEIERRVSRLESGVNRQFGEVHIRLERIENILLEDIQRRVEMLEQKVGTGK